MGLQVTAVSLVLGRSDPSSSVFLGRDHAELHSRIPGMVSDGRELARKKEGLG
jgi:hypothetical protein